MVNIFSRINKELGLNYSPKQLIILGIFTEYNTIYIGSQPNVNEMLIELDFYNLESTGEEVKCTVDILNEYINKCLIDEYNPLTSWFARAHPNFLHWNIVSLYLKLDESFIQENVNKIVWENLGCNRNIDENILVKFKENLNYYTSVSSRRNLSKDFIISHNNELSWDLILQENTKIDLNFVLKYDPYVKFHWELITRYIRLTDDQIEKYKDLVDWYIISFFYPINLDFVDKFKDKLIWPLISESTTLTKDIILKYKDKINFLIVKDSVYEKLNLTKKEAVSLWNKKDYIKPIFDKLPFYMVYNFLEANNIYYIRHSLFSSTYRCMLYSLYRFFKKIFK